jgi:hypothetical protein
MTQDDGSLPMTQDDAIAIVVRLRTALLALQEVSDMAIGGEAGEAVNEAWRLTSCVRDELAARFGLDLRGRLL